MEITIRPMFPSDLTACAAIEATAADAWSLDQLVDELCSDAGRLFVAAEEKKIMGLAVYQLAAGEANLVALTVDPAIRRRGVGKKLLEESLAALKEQGAASCYLEVRAENHPAYNLYIGSGFKNGGLRKDFYKNPPDDAIVMSYTL